MRIASLCLPAAALLLAAGLSPAGAQQPAPAAQAGPAETAEEKARREQDLKLLEEAITANAEARRRLEAPRRHRHLARRAHRRQVGEQGARADAGDRLARLVRERIPPTVGKILHVCGEEVRDGLEAALVEAGYTYERLVVYRTEPASRLAPRTVQALQSHEIDAVLFYSPRTAQVFAQLVERDALAGELAHASAVCLSEAIASEIRHLPWRSVEIAARRDQTALLACLEDLAAAMIAQHGIVPGRRPFSRGR